MEQVQELLKELQQQARLRHLQSMRIGGHAALFEECNQPECVALRERLNREIKKE